MSLRVALALLVAASAFAPDAYAQTAADMETARALFHEGKELRAKGDLRGALEKLRAAHAAGRTPITGLELARTHELLRELVEAREVALDVARIRVAPDETERSTEARAEAATLAEELRARIPDVTVHVTGVPDGAVPDVTIDGRPMPPPLVGEPFKLDPGTHDVAVLTKDGASSQATVTVAERESKQVTIPYPVPAPGAAAGPHDPAASAEPTGKEPATFVAGAALALVPSYFFPQHFSQQADVTGRSDQPEFGIGLQAEAGASLTPGFEVFLRAIASAGTKGKPISSIIGGGPAMSFHVARRWWVGATLYTGRSDMLFEGQTYSTDWVFAPTFDVSFAAIEWPAGQWLVSISPGYFFANVKQDNALIFVPLTFGYRSY
jgi:hypothetical protein